MRQRGRRELDGRWTVAALRCRRADLVSGRVRTHGRSRTSGPGAVQPCRASASAQLTAPRPPPNRLAPTAGRAPRARSRRVRARRCRSARPTRGRRRLRPKRSSLPCAASACHARAAATTSRCTSGGGPSSAAACDEEMARCARLACAARFARASVSAKALVPFATKAPGPTATGGRRVHGCGDAPWAWDVGSMLASMCVSSPCWVSLRSRRAGYRGPVRQAAFRP